MLDCGGDVRGLFRQVVDIESVSGREGPLADAVMAALAGRDHLSVERHGNVIVARTAWGRPQRVIVAGHLDTVPVKDNLPSRLTTVDGRAALVGRGTCDMKGGLAAGLALAWGVTDAAVDLTWVFYDNEEVEAAKNGLGLLAAARPDLLRADMAILMEPTDGALEAGCQGTLRADLTTTGVAAHTARSWLGHNAIHEMAGVLAALEEYEAPTVMVEGLAYREGLNAVWITGGVAGNVVPDRCTVSVNYRFAPDKTVAEAEATVRDLLAGQELTVTDAAPAARPNLGGALMRSFVDAVGAPIRPKLGWTDVARFAGLGIPAINYGPGDPNLCHTDGEWAFLDAVQTCHDTLREWLTA